MNRILILFLLLSISCRNETKQSGLESLWSFSFEGTAEALSLLSSTPVIIENSILISPDGQITMLGLKSGDKQWAINLDGDFHVKTSELLIRNNKLYLKDDRNNLLQSIEIQNGEVDWQVSSSPYSFFQHANDGYDDKNLYLTGEGYEILVFSLGGIFKKRIPMINYDVETDPRSIRVENNQLIFSQRIRNENCAVDNCGRILSIDKETEEVLWEYRTDRGGFIFEPILLEDGIIYAGVTDGPGEFVALDATNGEVIWRTRGIIGQSYTLTDSMVLVNDGIRLLALDKSTGKELWNTGLAFGGGDSGNNISYLDGYVYHSHSSSLYILEGNTGEIVHQEPRSPDGSPFGLLTAGDGKVFVQSDYALYAYTAWE